MRIWNAWRILFTFPPTISNQSNKGIVTSLLETRNWEKVGNWINLIYATIFKTNRLRERLSQLQFSTSHSTNIYHRDSRTGAEISVSIFMPIWIALTRFRQDHLSIWEQNEQNKPNAVTILKATSFNNSNRLFFHQSSSTRPMIMINKRNSNYKPLPAITVQRWLTCYCSSVPSHRHRLTPKY